MKNIYLFLFLIITIPSLSYGQSTPCNLDYPGNNFENAEYGLNQKYIANDFDIAEGVTMEIEMVMPTIVNNIEVADIFIYEDDNGQPGTLITSFQDVEPTSQTQVSDYFNMPWYEVELELPTSLTLEGGSGGSKYWLGLFVTMGSDGAVANFWETTTVGTTAVIHTSEDQGETWTPSPEGFDGVFQVFGQCVTEDPTPTDPCEIVEAGNDFENAEYGLNQKYIANDFDIAAGTTMEIETVIPTIVNNIEVADIFIYEDDNGQPGTLITSFQDVEPISQTQVSDYFNMPWYEVELDLPTSLTLEGGAGGSKYWLGLFVTMGSDGATANFWEVKTNGTTALTHTSMDQGETWDPSPSGFDGVFQVIGQCSEEDMLPCEIVEAGNDFENAEFGLNLKYIANDFDIAEGATMEIETVIPTIVNNIEVADIFIYEDDNGQPGALITSFQDVEPISQTQVSDYFNMPWYEVELELPSSLTLEGGAGGSKYWLGLFVTMGSDGATANFWEVKTNGTTALTHTSMDQGETWDPSPSGFDGVFQIIGNCEGEIVIPDDYCEVVVNSEVAPITNVTFAGIENTSSADSTSPAQEYFLDIEGTVDQGEEYIISVEGNTNGDFTSYFTAFIDWNQNGILDDAGEVYEIGAITNSTGSDGQNATRTIAVPFHADIDQTRIRIIKSRDSYTLDPCSSIDIGQAEDYALQVNEGEDDYCEVDVVVTVEPITKVIFADIENTSSADTSSPGHEYFLDVEGNVEMGSTYTITVEGNTNGNTTNYLTAFIDWNQNGILDDEGEIYEIGPLTNSTGNDGQQVSHDISIPFDALSGSTRMRIIKWHYDYPIDPCSSIVFGQAEDYTLNVSEYQDPYCDVVITDTVTPITKLTFAGIENPSSDSTNAPAQEYFVDITGFVEQGNEYIVRLEGVTDGDNTHYFTAFFDWNQNGVLDDEDEVYHLGTITNSTGTDGIELVTRIDVPAHAELGETRFRIIKSAEAYPLDPCGTYSSGQAENYSLNVFEYCEPNIINTAPITRVVFSDIDNASSLETSSPTHEYFLDVEGTVITGESQEIIIEGNTVGAWDSCFSVFIDWNQNGVLDDEGEVYQIDCIFASTGDDGQQAIGTIEIPEDAALGRTRMRVIGSDQGLPLDPCSYYSYGQAEDYTIIVRSSPFPTCTIECPDDISVQIPIGQTHTEVDYSISFDCDNPDGVELRLVAGLPSGSEFPVGTTIVRYNLELEGEVITTCEFNITVEATLDVDDFAAETFVAYPNPVSDILNISSSKVIESIQVFDLSGKKLLEVKPGKEISRLDLSGFASGVYMVRLTSKDSIKVVKIIKT